MINGSTKSPAFTAGGSGGLVTGSGGLAGDAGGLGVSGSSGVSGDTGGLGYAAGGSPRMAAGASGGAGGTGIVSSPMASSGGAGASGSGSGASSSGASGSASGASGAGYSAGSPGGNRTLKSPLGDVTDPGDPQLWQLESVYPGLDSPQYKGDIQELRELIERAGTVFAEEPDSRTRAVEWLTRCLDLQARIATLDETLESYLYCRYSTDTRDSAVMAELNAVEAMVVPAKTAQVVFRNSLARACSRGFFGRALADPPGSSRGASQAREVSRAIRESLADLPPGLADFRFVLEEALEEQKHQMGPELEDLAADLNRSGGEAWGRLQQQISSNLSMPWKNPGETDKMPGTPPAPASSRDSAEGSRTGDPSGSEEQPDQPQRKTVIELRSLAFDPDRRIRKQAYELELEAWRQVEIPMAAAINGVKGFSISIDSRRGYEESLDRSVALNRITRKTLDAMISAMEQHLPDFRRYLRKKAELLGLERLSFYDIFAPLKAPDPPEPATSRADGNPRPQQNSGRGQSFPSTWSYEQAGNFIIETFRGFSRDLGDFAAKAFESRWIDARPRPGKVGGAYCTDLPKPGESRILANFDGSFSSVSTLAHELGHAYHSYVLRDQPQLLRSYPMTLAETASIFCETIIYNTAIENSGGFQRLSLIEGILSESTQVIVDILSRFYFERSLFGSRKNRELSPDELCQAMVQAQKDSYGPGLNQEELHPYMWAVKGHYYSPELAFYNFPYAFGQLFGLGLYAQYRENPKEFPEAYRTILVETGRANAVDVCKSAGFSIETPDFWNQGLSAIVDFVNIFTKGST